MNLTHGVYKCWEIDVGIIPESSGQIAVSMHLLDASLTTNLAEVPDKQIREYFSLPKADTDKLHFGRSDAKTIGWCFMFSCISGAPTMYEFLASIFHGLDELTSRIVKNNSSKPEKQGVKNGKQTSA